jgi:exopolysaccharide biosynthesis predicted pyruvyltransferase EpsI
MDSEPQQNPFQFLKELREPIHYFPNPGNGGDSLISYATFQQFDRWKIPYEIVTSPNRFRAEGRIAVYAGGGNFSHERCRAAEIVQRLSPVARRVILLPHSIVHCEGLLAQLGGNVDLFCRERMSWEHVLRHATSARVHLADDVAFGLEVEELCQSRPKSTLLAEIAKKFYFMATRDDREWLTCGKRAMVEHAFFRLKRPNVDDTNGTLYCFRKDYERTSAPLPDHNLDISEIFSLGNSSRATTRFAAFSFVSFIDRYHTVVTNRLHVAIAGALLNKRVELHPNSYYKNQAIYEMSLAGRFPNVTWMGESPSKTCAALPA